MVTGRLGANCFKKVIHCVRQSRIILKAPAAGNHQTKCILFSGFLRLVPHNQETNQLKVVQTFDGVFQKANLFTAQETADVAFILDLDNGGNGIAQQAGKAVHFAAVVGLFIECPILLAFRKGAVPQMTFAQLFDLAFGNIGRFFKEIAFKKEERGKLSYGLVGTLILVLTYGLIMLFSDRKSVV